MPRKYANPYTDEDLQDLLSRHSKEHVKHLVALQEGEDAEEGALADFDPIGDPDVGANHDGAGDGNEDLIGAELYDPLTHTNDEVLAYLADASEEEKARVITAENAREDREPRKGIVGS